MINSFDIKLETLWEDIQNDSKTNLFRYKIIKLLNDEFSYNGIIIWIHPLKQKVVMI